MKYERKRTNKRLPKPFIDVGYLTFSNLLEHHTHLCLAIPFKYKRTDFLLNGTHGYKNSSSTNIDVDKT